MKILILGLPNSVEDGQIPSACAILAKYLNITEVDLQGNIMLDTELSPVFNRNKLPEKSKFMKAVESILKAAPAEVTIDSVAFRSWFYSKVIDRTIEKPILETLAFGPVNSSDTAILRRNNIVNLAEYAKVAISMLQ